MTVALILGVAVIAWIAFGRGAATSAVVSFTGQFQRGTPPIIGSYPANQGPAVPGSLQTSITIGNAVDGTGAAAQKLASATSAVPIVGAAIGAAVQIFNAIWGAHEARLKGATDENQAVPLATSVYDESIAAIAQNWNASHDQQDCLNALEQLRQNTYNYLKGRVGAPGTAWRDNPPFPCDRSCTVGCCLYWNDFYSDPTTVGGSTGFGIVGMMTAIQNGGNATVTIQKVYPSKYQSFSRPLYKIVLT